MEQNRVLRDFFRYVSLSICGMLGVSCYILADTYFIARGLGVTGLAALNLAIPAYNVIHGIGLMVGVGGATRFTIDKSRGGEHRANVMFTHAAALGAVFALLLAAVGLLWSGSLARLLGADDTVFAMTDTYLRVLLLFSPVFIANDVFQSFVRNDGQPRLAMVATVSGSFGNILLDYVFIFPCQMGMFGAVFATGLSPVISILVMLPYLRRRDRGFRLTKTAAEAETVRTDLVLGFPSLVGQVSSAVVMVVFNLIILDLRGNVGVAAYGVIANLSLVVTGVLTGLAQGIQPLLSGAFGLGRWETVRRVMGYALRSALVLGAALYLVTALFAGPIAMAFNSQGDPVMQELAVAGLLIYFTSNLPTGLNLVLAQYFTSVEQPLPAHVISLLRGFVVVIPMAFLLAATWGMTGVWLTVPATEGLVLLASAALYRRYIDGK